MKQLLRLVLIPQRAILTHRALVACAGLHRSCSGAGAAAATRRSAGPRDIPSPGSVRVLASKPAAPGGCRPSRPPLKRKHNETQTDAASERRSGRHASGVEAASVSPAVPSVSRMSRTRAWKAGKNSSCCLTLTMTLRAGGGQTTVSNPGTHRRGTWERARYLSRSASPSRAGSPAGRRPDEASRATWSTTSAGDTLPSAEPQGDRDRVSGASRWEAAPPGWRRVNGQVT